MENKKYGNKNAKSRQMKGPQSKSTSTRSASSASKSSRTSNSKGDKNKALIAIGWILSVIQLALSVAVVVFLMMLGVLGTLYNVLVIVGLVILLALTRFLMWKDRPRAKWIIGAILSVIISVALAFATYYLYGAWSALKNITDDEEYTIVSVYVLKDDKASEIKDAESYTFGYSEVGDTEVIDKTILEINKDIYGSGSDAHADTEANTSSSGANATSNSSSTSNSTNSSSKTTGALSTSGNGVELTSATSNTTNTTNTTIDTKVNGKSITTQPSTDMLATADSLLKKKVGAIIMEEAVVETIAEEEGYENFPNEIKEIARYKIAKKVKSSNRRDVFNLYISGIDTTGSVNKRSRSDVNIIAAVNTNTHQILLVTTPRDAYVPNTVSKGMPDKLTHAGLYGVECSMGTLEQLYSIPLDYYFRINFSGFEKVIDALGGIDVESPISFEASNGGYNISKGMNHLNGAEALGFARERFAFADGDRQRGKDQMAVIKDVVKKAASPAILNNYSQLMKGLTGTFQTNMPEDIVSEIASKQVANGGDWNIQTYSVEGTGASKKTYSMPNTNAYVSILNDASVKQAADYINRVNNGEIIEVAAQE